MNQSYLSFFVRPLARFGAGGSVKRLAVAAAVAATIGVTVGGCGAGPDGSEPYAQVDTSIRASTPLGPPNLMWHNPSTGQLNIWRLDGVQFLDNNTTLSGSCGAANGCDPPWKPVEVGDPGNGILWHNDSSGEFGFWTFDANGGVTVHGIPRALNCAQSAGCGARAIGTVSFASGLTDGLLFHDFTSGFVTIDPISVDPPAGLGAEQALDMKCGVSDQCSSSWQAVLTADFNGDGTTDLLWYNPGVGTLRIWYISNQSVGRQILHVLGTQDLSAVCGSASGCHQQWNIIGATDINGDGHVDLIWHRPSTGEIGTWLLDGSGGVTIGKSLSKGCSTASGCSPAWQPLGFVRLPLVPHTLTTLVNASSCLDSDGAGNVTMNACNGANSQKWYQIPAGAGDGSVKIVDVQTGLCLDNNDPAHPLNPQVHARSCTGGPFQRWTAGPNGTGGVDPRLFQNIGTKICLEASPGNVTDTQTCRADVNGNEIWSLN